MANQDQTWLSLTCISVCPILLTSNNQHNIIDCLLLHVCHCNSSMISLFWQRKSFCEVSLLVCLILRGTICIAELLQWFHLSVWSLFFQREQHKRENKCTIKIKRMSETVLWFLFCFFLSETNRWITLLRSTVILDFIYLFALIAIPSIWELITNLHIHTFCLILTLLLLSVFRIVLCAKLSYTGACRHQYKCK